MTPQMFFEKTPDDHELELANRLLVISMPYGYINVLGMVNRCVTGRLHINKAAQLVSKLRAFKNETINMPEWITHNKQNPFDYIYPLSVIVTRSFFLKNPAERLAEFTQEIVEKLHEEPSIARAVDMPLSREQRKKAEAFIKPDLAIDIDQDQAAEVRDFLLSEKAFDYETIAGYLYSISATKPYMTRMVRGQFNIFNAIPEQDDIGRILRQLSFVAYAHGFMTTLVTRAIVEQCSFAIATAPLEYTLKLHIALDTNTMKEAMTTIMSAMSSDKHDDEKSSEDMYQFINESIPLLSLLMTLHSYCRSLMMDAVKKLLPDSVCAFNAPNFHDIAV